MVPFGSAFKAKCSLIKSNLASQYLFLSFSAYNFSAFSGVGFLLYLLVKSKTAISSNLTELETLLASASCSKNFYQYVFLDPVPMKVPTTSLSILVAPYY